MLVLILLEFSYYIWKKPKVKKKKYKGSREYGFHEMLEGILLQHTQLKLYMTLSKY